MLDVVLEEATKIRGKIRGKKAKEQTKHTKDNYFHNPQVKALMPRAIQMEVVVVVVLLQYSRECVHIFAREN